MLPFAVRTGLEPATPGVTGRYSNQLNYRTNLFSLMRFSQTRMQRYAKNLNLQIFCVLFMIFFLFDLNYPLFCLRFGCLDLRNPDMEHSIFHLCLHIVFVGILRKDEGLMEFTV